jgi:serine/threonine-protein kinase
LNRLTVGRILYLGGHVPARVVLKIGEGKLAGHEFVFEECSTCLVGRASDCAIRLPDDADHRGVSRHHCLLDLNPPDARIRDFGSLNGTFVNGRRIGRRARDQAPNEVDSKGFPQIDLRDGDRIKLGKTIFQVSIYRPAICLDCQAEIPEADTSVSKVEHGFRCAACRERPAAKPQESPPVGFCPICGRDVSEEAAGRAGQFVCVECKKDPNLILKHILAQAGPQSPNAPKIKDYAIEKELGRGGMGVVYLARHRLTGQQAALKVMLPEVAVDKRNREMFLREARITKALNHPNIVQLLDSGFSDGVFFFTLEFCDGGSVDRLMAQKGGSLPVDEALGIILPALDGLEYAHRAKITIKTRSGELDQKKGLVHRDLKPANIFLSGTGAGRTPKIADMGLAKAFRAAGLSGLTATGSAAGSPWFMPRQQLVRFKYASPEVDVWAMAASLYNMLTGALPRNFTSDRDPWLTVLQQPTIPIQSRRPDLPTRLAQVIDEALRDDRDLRFKSAALFKKALEGAI